MGKTGLISIAIATGVVATAAPAAFLASGGGQSKPSTGPFIPQLNSASDITQENKYQEVECLKNCFGTITFGGSTANPLKSEHVNTFSPDSQSCLVVEYNKKTYKEEKWQGSFRLIWAVKNDTQGLITVTYAKTIEGEMKGNSSAYLLNKNTSDNSWTTKHKQETTLVKKKGVGDDFSNLIPQKESSIPGTIGTGNHWGFDADLNKICEKDKCTETETKSTHNSYSWDFVKDEAEGKEIYSWNSNIDTWLEKILAWKELKNKMNTVKGKWKENRILSR